MRGAGNGEDESAGEEDGEANTVDADFTVVNEGDEDEADKD